MTDDVVTRIEHYIENHPGATVMEVLANVWDAHPGQYRSVVETLLADDDPEPIDGADGGVALLGTAQRRCPLMAATAAVQHDVDELDERALTEYLTVLEDVGRVRDCSGQYLVVAESGSEYLVDARLEACECPDFEYRDRRCKHIRRVAFAISAEPVPAPFGPADIAGELGEHCSGSPRWSR